VETYNFTLETLYAYTFVHARWSVPVSVLCLHALGQTSPGKFSAHPQAADEDPVAILELGASASWNFSGGAATFAPNLAEEITPIENWLEVEAGVSPFYTRNSTEWDTDLFFKKPWTLSRKAEFMLGVGPEWVHLNQNGKASNSITGRWREALCSGQRENTASDGILNPLTTTALQEATSSPLA
jgi:hypothetical protein